MIAAVRPNPRILVVEDEPVIAMVVQDSLSDAGFDIAGTASRLPAALDLIENTAFDAAILDANLAGVSAGPAASALRTRNLPFVVFSGYMAKEQDSLFDGAPIVTKPAEPAQLIQALRDILPAA